MLEFMVRVMVKVRVRVRIRVRARVKIRVNFKGCEWRASKERPYLLCVCVVFPSVSLGMVEEWEPFTETGPRQTDRTEQTNQTRPDPTRPDQTRPDQNRTRFFPTLILFSFPAPF